MEADFSGYATKAGLKCSDGRTITPEAFKHMDSMRVPLVWQHAHNSPDNVLGHAILEARPDGVYTKGYFNDTPQGKNARELVQHGDIDKLSIYANQLVEKGKTVLHGIIREVSLVLAGANPGAMIDYVRVAHGQGEVEVLEDEAVIYTGLKIEHAEEEEDETLEHKTLQEVYDSMDEEQKGVVHYMIGAALEANADNAEKAAEHSDTKVDETKTDDDTKVDETKDENKTDDDKAGEGDLNHQEGKGEMTRNVFDQNNDTKTELRHTLTQDDVKGIVQHAIKIGSLKDAVEDYALKHGIENIDLLFPDAQTLDDRPEFDKRRTEWVAGVLSGTRHSPFSRVKTLTADITQEDARAKGYIKGNYKVEEWFGVTKRTTSPTTVYKKQKLDRDDMLDITTFDVVAWLKQEMRLMLEEEIARAILIGDGREVSDLDKIKDPMGQADGVGIRSIANDHELFATTINVNVDDASSSYSEVVDAIMDGMEHYKGTGTPNFYTTIKTLNKFLQLKDGMGRRLYNTKAEVAAALGVREVVTVDPMNDEPSIVGIIVNLQDYNVGADRGGEVSMFDDFDIDYNQHKYLIESRLSGALVRIKSAVVVRKTAGTNVLVAPNEPTFIESTGVVTIPSKTGVVYKNDTTGATLTAGAQSALSAGQTLKVRAEAASGYYFGSNADDQWSFKRPSA